MCSLKHPKSGGHQPPSKNVRGVRCCLVVMLRVLILCVCVFCLGVYAATSWFLYSSNGWSMHGRYVSASLRAGRVPTAIYRARQTATSGHANDNVAAVDSAAIGRDAVT